MHAAAPASADEAAAGDSCKAAAIASGGAAALRELSRSASHAAGSPAVRSYVRALNSRWGAYAVFAFWLALSCVGLSSYKKVIPALNTKFEPIPGSNLGEAMAALSASFPGNSTIDSYAVRGWAGAGQPPGASLLRMGTHVWRVRRSVSSHAPMRSSSGRMGRALCPRALWQT